MKNGRLTIQRPNGELSPETTKSAFASSTTARFCRVHNCSEPWTMFSCMELQVRDDAFSGTIGFNGENLEFIILASRRSEFGLALSELSREKEQARQGFHNEWLSRQLAGQVATQSHGPDTPVWTWTFPWGRIVSGWDVKNGTAELVIRYRQDGQPIKPI